MKATEREIDTLARTLYGEAEANNVADAKAIGSVILNRVDYPNWPNTIAEVCLQPYQFSAWNPGDPNRQRILTAKSTWFNRCREIAVGLVSGDIDDPTHGSTHYYATYIKRPKWAKGKTPVYAVTHAKGHEHLFYNDIDTKPPKTAREALDQAKPLSHSRTVVGGSVASADAVASETVNEVKDQVEPLLPYADSLRLIFLFVALAGIGLTIWSRVNARRQGIR